MYVLLTACQAFFRPLAQCLMAQRLSTRPEDAGERTAARACRRMLAARGAAVQALGGGPGAGGGTSGITSMKAANRTKSSVLWVSTRRTP